MRAYDNGCFYSCSVSANEVYAFSRTWPCANLPHDKSIWFQFDKRNGDLVDVDPGNLEERGADGSALIALKHDAQAYAKKRLKLA